MSNNNFTCLTNPQLPELAEYLRALKPSVALWVQFQTPILNIKAEPALSCIYQAITNEVDPTHLKSIKGVTAIYTPDGTDCYPASYQFPIFLSTTDLDLNAEVQLYMNAAKHVVCRLNACDGSYVFQHLTVGVIKACAHLELVCSYEKQGVIDAPDYLKVLIHLPSPVDKFVTNSNDEFKTENNIEVINE